MPLRQFAEGVWIDSGPTSIVGMRLTAVMTVLCLNDGGLLLYSPIGMTAERRAEVEALGPITHLYAPSLYHHLWIGEWAEAFPKARLHGPAGLSKKRKDLRIDRIHASEPEPAFADTIDEIPVDGFRLGETVLLYRPAATLVVADLVHNVGRPEGLWTQVYSRMMGFYDRVALSRMLRWTSFSDRAAARRSVEKILALPFDRLVVGHGEPLAAGGKDALRAALGWLVRGQSEG